MICQSQKLDCCNNGLWWCYGFTHLVGAWSTSLFCWWQSDSYYLAWMAHYLTSNPHCWLRSTVNVNCESIIRKELRDFLPCSCSSFWWKSPASKSPTWSTHASCWSYSDLPGKSNLGHHLASPAQYQSPMNCPPWYRTIFHSQRQLWRRLRCLPLSSTD